MDRQFERVWKWEASDRTLILLPKQVHKAFLLRPQDISNKDKSKSRGPLLRCYAYLETNICVPVASNRLHLDMIDSIEHSTQPTNLVVYLAFTNFTNVHLSFDP